MDFLQSRKYKEWALVCLVGVATLFALLPADLADQLSINRNYIAAILGILLVIALFLYLKFAFFIMVALLVIGANITDSWSDTLGISKLPLIIALIAMVGISLINYVVSILPTGLEPKPREKSPEGVKAMFYAIEKDNLVYAQKVLSMNFDPNRAQRQRLHAAAICGHARQCADGRAVPAQWRQRGAALQGRRERGRAGVENGPRSGRRSTEESAPGTDRAGRGCQGRGKKGTPGMRWKGPAR